MSGKYAWILGKCERVLRDCLTFFSGEAAAVACCFFFCDDRIDHTRAELAQKKKHIWSFKQGKLTVWLNILCLGRRFFCELYYGACLIIWEIGLGLIGGRPSADGCKAFPHFFATPKYFSITNFTEHLNCLKRRRLLPRTTTKKCEKYATPQNFDRIFFFFSLRGRGHSCNPFSHKPFSAMLYIFEWKLEPIIPYAGVYGEQMAQTLLSRIFRNYTEIFSSTYTTTPCSSSSSSSSFFLRNLTPW